MNKSILTWHPGWPCCQSPPSHCTAQRRRAFPLLSAGLPDLEGAAPAEPSGSPGPASGPGHMWLCLRSRPRKDNVQDADLLLLLVGLRAVEAQDLLSHLAACANIYLVASMDHVNTPLLWDKQVAARFNWLWYDVTNYVPYTLECAHVPSLLVGRR